MRRPVTRSHEHWDPWRHQLGAGENQLLARAPSRNTPNPRDSLSVSANPALAAASPERTRSNIVSAEVMDENVGAFRGDGAGLAVGVLETCGRGFVEYPAMSNPATWNVSKDKSRWAERAWAGTSTTKVSGSPESYLRLESETSSAGGGINA